MQARMKHLSPQHKHSILLEYQSYSRDHSFAALATRHGITGGAEVIRRWHSRWNGTAASLEEKAHTGRPRVLTTQEVQRYVAPRIRANNRNAQRIHYTDIHAAVEQHTGKSFSPRTLRNYGKHDLDAHQTHGKKRTADVVLVSGSISLTQSCMFVFVKGSVI
jgi:transposase